MLHHKTITSLLHTALLAVCLSACTTNGVVEPEKQVDKDPMPMRFSSSATTEQVVTRATTLTSDFMVSTWKDGDAEVMYNYKVDYDATNKSWNYVNVNSQLQRYWDLSAYPYEFKAVSPYNDNAVDITHSSLHIDCTKADLGLMQSGNMLEGKLITENDPFVVAHTQRSAKDSNENYIDYDIQKDGPDNAAALSEDNQTNAVRDVHLPFHHLMSKVAFRVYVDASSLYPNIETITLSKVHINVYDAKDKFILSSSEYTQSQDDTGSETRLYSGNTLASAGNTTNGEYPLLTHTAAYDGVNLKDKDSRDVAFNFNLSDGMLEVPQQNVRLHVTLTLTTNTNVTYEYDTVLGQDTTAPHGDYFTWLGGKKYIYILKLSSITGKPIVLYTCEVVPWDEVNSTDINVGM
ncbi:MAG: fimbrillin family protein [Prevotella sp.]